MVLRASKHEEEDWDNLESLAKEYLAKTTADHKSFKGFFYFGIALYRQGNYENAI